MSKPEGGKIETIKERATYVYLPLWSCLCVGRRQPRRAGLPSKSS